MRSKEFASVRVPQHLTQRFAGGPLLFFVCVLISACALQPTVAAEVSISWNGSCDASGSVEFFSITFTQSGGMLYRGMNGVQSRGESGVAVPVDASESRELAIKLEELVESGVGKAPEKLDCLVIAANGSSVRVAPSDERVARVHKLVRESNDLRTLICPAQRSVPLRDEYCTRPAVAFVYREQSSCRYRQTTEIYADGVTHFYVVGPSMTSGDQYGRIPASSIIALQRIPEGAPREEMMGFGLRSFSLFGPYASQYQAQLQRVTTLQSRDALPRDATCAADTREYPLGQLLTPQ